MTLQTSELPIPSERPWALFLDVDGTLLELAEHPEAVVVPEGLPSLLRNLRAALDGALALASGRSIASLDALLRTEWIDAAGCHGAEIRMAGSLSVIAKADADMAQAAGRLVELAAPYPLSFVELKAHSAAFHFKDKELTPDLARRLAVAAISGHEGRLRLLDGKQVVEIMPLESGKGKAIARFLAQPPYRDKLPVFVGDDVTDEEGFEEVNRQGGVSIHVGARQDTCAQYRAKTVADVAAWLSGPVCRALRCHEGARSP